MMDRITLLADLRAQNINLQAVLENNRRLIRQLEAMPVVAPPPVVLQARGSLQRGRPKDVEMERQISEALLAGGSVAGVAEKLFVSKSRVYRVKQRLTLARLNRPTEEPPPPAEPPIVDLDVRTASRIEAYLERHGPTAYSHILQAIDITPREFNEATPHLVGVEKIDGLWQVKPQIGVPLKAF